MMCKAKHDLPTLDKLLNPSIQVNCTSNARLLALLLDYYSPNKLQLPPAVAIAEIDWLQCSQSFHATAPIWEPKRDLHYVAAILNQYRSDSFVANEPVLHAKSS